MARSTLALDTGGGPHCVVELVVDRERGGEPGELEDVTGPFAGDHEVQGGAEGPGPLEDGDERPQAGGVDEVDARKVDDKQAVALEEVPDRQLTDPGRGT